MEDSEEVASASALDGRHAKERKDLQSKITALKYGVKKDDKKRRKEVLRQCEQMEEEMKKRHETEMNDVKEQMSTMNIGGDKKEPRSNGLEEDAEEKPFFKEMKLTKAQRKKVKIRAEKATARSRAEEEDAEQAEYSQGNIESEAMKRVLDERGLVLFEVAPDGDCMYSALAHQATASGVEKFSAAGLRKMAANYLRGHKEEFLAFLVDADENPLDEMEFEEYCFKVSRMSGTGGSWGGEPELRALSSSLERPIEVLHANGRVSLFGEEFRGKSLAVTFHKFAYTLGEHYNSTTPK